MTLHNKTESDPAFSLLSILYCYTCIKVTATLNKAFEGLAGKSGVIDAADLVQVLNAGIERGCVLFFCAAVSVTQCFIEIYIIGSIWLMKSKYTIAKV